MYTYISICICIYMYIYIYICIHIYNSQSIPRAIPGTGNFLEASWSLLGVFWEFSGVLNASARRVGEAQAALVPCFSFRNLYF